MSTPTGIAAKECPCGARGEWPGRVCPPCRDRVRAVAAERELPEAEIYWRTKYDALLATNARLRSMLYDAREFLAHYDPDQVLENALARRAILFKRLEGVGIVAGERVGTP